MKIHDEFRCLGVTRPVGYTDENVKSDIAIMAREIEDLFGLAVNGWSLRFVCFSNTADCPHIYYPDGFERTVGIKLAASALTDVDFARFQIAHELVHCLAPSGGEKAFVIEEGVAAKYQQSYSKRYLGGRMKIGDSRYKEALKLYNELAKRYSGAIKKLRRVEPWFYNWSHETFLLADMHLENSFESLLLTRFKEFCQ